ncbi:hypothetical protein OSTOST_09314, partial [Ostertagia ostertagi]
MSTSRTATRKCDLQDVTECPICCLRFERPLQLSCGHSFCGNCVDRLIADARGPGNRNDNYLEAVRGLAANIDQGVNPPHFNRMDQDLWWPLNLNRQQMMPPPPPGLGGIPHPPRYILRNFNDEVWSLLFFVHNLLEFSISGFPKSRSVGKYGKQALAGKLK